MSNTSRPPGRNTRSHSGSTSRQLGKWVITLSETRVSNAASGNGMAVTSPPAAGSATHRRACGTRRAWPGNCRYREGDARIEQRQAGAAAADTHVRMSWPRARARINPVSTWFLRRLSRRFRPLVGHTNRPCGGRPGGGLEADDFAVTGHSISPIRAFSEQVLHSHRCRRVRRAT